MARRSRDGEWALHAESAAARQRLGVDGPRARVARAVGGCGARAGGGGARVRAGAVAGEGGGGRLRRANVANLDFLAAKEWVCVAARLAGQPGSRPIGLRLR